MLAWETGWEQPLSSVVSPMDLGKMERRKEGGDGMFHSDLKVGVFTGPRADVQWGAVTIRLNLREQGTVE